MMGAKRVDFIATDCGGRPCEQGADFSYGITWQTENPAGSGIYVPVDLTGFSADLQVRASAGDTTLVTELSTGNGGITLGGITGQINLLITALNTALIPAGQYKYDLFLTAPGGQVTRLTYGAFQVVARITV